MTLPKRIKAAFLDRDGVINREINYLHRIEDFEYTYKCIQALDNLRNLGYHLVLVTNQAGIAKGIYPERDYQRLTDWLIKDLANHGIRLLATAHCPHHPSGVIPEYTRQCTCRKPEPGMILDMIHNFDIDPASSILVGDKLTDIEAGRRAGIHRNILVRSGHTIDESKCQDIEIHDNLYKLSLSMEN